MITGWISALFPYLKDGRTGLATNRNRYLTPDSQRVEDIDDEIDGIDDIDIDEEDGEDIDELDENPESPPARRPLNRLILNRKQNAGDSLVPNTQQDIEKCLGSDPDLDDDFDEDDDDELVVGAWLRPMPKRRRNDEGDDLGLGWGPRISDLPLGISKVPFCWQFRKQSFDMQFLGGFVGVSQDKDTLAVKPKIGWAVREAPAAR
jgi:hypothetical protein